MIYDVRDTFVYATGITYPNYYQRMLYNVDAVKKSIEQAIWWEEKAKACLKKGIFYGADFAAKRAIDHERYAMEYARYAFKQMRFWIHDMVHAEDPYAAEQEDME